MDDLRLMQINQRPHNLLEIVLHLHLRQPLPPLYKLIQGLISAYLQQDVDVLMILEDMLKFYYVLMRKGFVDLYLGNQLHQ
jgi:hypothetical protein